MGFLKPKMPPLPPIPPAALPPVVSAPVTDVQDKIKEDRKRRKGKAATMLTGGAGLTISTAASAVDVIPYFVKASGSIQLGAPQLAFA